MAFNLDRESSSFWKVWKSGTHAKILSEILASDEFHARAVTEIVDPKQQLPLIESIVLPPGAARDARKVCTDRLKGDPLFSSDKAVLGVAVETMGSADAGGAQALAIMAAMNKERLAEMMKACRETLAQGSSIMMFPEGTRSPDGRLRAFKSGAFELALEGRRPILPIVLRGTADALPKRGFVLQGRHPISIQVLDPLPYESFAGESAEALMQRVHALIASHVAAAPPRPRASDAQPALAG